MAFATNRTGSRWPDGIMPFEIASAFSDDQEQTVRDAIDHWNTRTIMRLVPRAAGHTDFVRFQPADDSCSSAVGRVAGGQVIGCDVGDGFSRGSVIHEIGHAAGFFHEHTRPDRDLHVTVDFTNIEADAVRNYEIRMNGTILTDYDYASIMHYPRRGGFAIDPAVDIIVPTPDATVEIGQRQGLSRLDLLGVLGLYGAPHFTVAWEDDDDRNGRADIWWAGLTRWGSNCGQQQRVHSSGDNNRVPTVAVDGDRNSMIAFEHRRGAKTHISMRALAANGRQHFGGNHHSADASQTNGRPDVAVHASGDFVLVWHEDRGGRRRLKGRGYFNNGTIRSPLQTLATDDTGIPAQPQVGIANDRSFVVAWSELVAPDALTVRARRFDRDGLATGAELVVDDHRIGDQDVFPRMVVAADGSFFVVYERKLRSVFLAGFGPDDTRLFDPFEVPTSTRGRQLRADIALTSAGELVIAWADDRNQNGLGQIRYRVLATDGTEIRADATANVRGGGNQQRPRVAALADGGYVIIWEDDAQRDGVYQVHAQVFEADHSMYGGPLTVNRNPRGTQTGPAVGA